MTQKHTMILWREPDLEIRSFDEIAKEAFDIMNVFQQFDNEWRPNKLVGYRQKDGPFEWNYEHFAEALKKGVNREGKVEFPDLGYRMGFYSSSNEDRCFGHSLHVGDTQFLNVLTVSIGLDWDLQNKLIADNLVLLFEELVEHFQPFWGCIANAKISKEYNYFNKEEYIPQTIYWVNYFNKTVEENIGQHKIDEVLSQYTNITMKNGILRLKDTMIDFNVELDVRMQQEVHHQLLHD